MTSRPHDALFKAAFESPGHAAGLLRGVLPRPICAALDWTTIEREAGSFIDPELRDSHSDLLFSVELGGRPALLYLLLEHQSTVVQHMSLRVSDYLLRIWTRHVNEHGLPLPLLMSVTISHAEGGWTAPLTLHDLIEPAPASIPGLAAMVPNHTMLLLDLMSVDDERLRNWALEAFPKLALLILREGRDPVRLLEDLGRWRDLVLTLQAAPNGADAVAQILRYVAQVTQDMHAKDFHATITRQLPETEKIAMTVAEELRQQGLEQGHEQCLRQTLTKLITLKFGPPSAEVTAHLEAATPEQLERYVERILSAESLDELLAK